MTKSPPRPPASSPQDTPPQNGGGFGLGGMVLRLVFLGLVGMIGSGAGLALAVFLPDRNPQAPLIETALQKLRLTGETRIAPNILPTVVPNINNSPEVLPVSPPVPISPKPSSSPEATITPASPPANAETAQLQQDLQQVQQQLKNLGDRTTSLEQKLGISNPNGSLETRLEKLSQQLQQSPQSTTPASTPLNTPKTASPSPPQTIASSPSSNTPATASPSGAIAPNSPPPITYGIAIQKKITLPIDSLFDGTSSTLRPEAILFLSQVANELRGIAGATVQVTAHSNLGGEPSNDRRLSFQQAKTIREYLATQLGDRFRFVAIGYGSTRPLLAPPERPENRRIEIIVE